jgi:hypothetical protein
MAIESILAHVRIGPKNIQERPELTTACIVCLRNECSARKILAGSEVNVRSSMLALAASGSDHLKRPEYGTCRTRGGVT